MSPDELIDAFQEAWTRRNPGAFADFCAPDFHYEDPFVLKPLEGPKALGAHAERLWAGFPDVLVERSGVRLDDGTFVAAPVRVTGTNEGELEGLPPTRKWVSLQVVLYCEVSEGRLWRVRAFCDRYDAAIQLGLLPKPGSMGEKALLALRGFGLSSRR